METERGTTAAKEDMECITCAGSDTSCATTQSLPPTRTCRHPLGGSVQAVKTRWVKFWRCVNAHYHQAFAARIGGLWD